MGPLVVCQYYCINSNNKRDGFAFPVIDTSFYYQYSVFFFYSNITMYCYYSTYYDDIAKKRANNKTITGS